MSDKIAVVFHAKSHAKIEPSYLGGTFEEAMSSFTEIPERIFQIDFRQIDGIQSCIIWDRVSGDRFKFIDIKSQRESLWSKLPKSKSLEEKVAYWIVELYKQSADSMLEEIQETVELFIEVMRAIRDDTEVKTPKTMSDPSPDSFDYCGLDSPDTILEVIEE